MGKLLDIVLVYLHWIIDIGPRPVMVDKTPDRFDLCCILYGIVCFKQDEYDYIFQVDRSNTLSLTPQRLTGGF